MNNSLHTPKQQFGRHVVFLIIGAVIITLVIIGSNEYEKSQQNILEEKKEHIKSIFTHQLQRKEAQLGTIASAISAFYANSDKVTDTEFNHFAQQILENVPEVKNVFVLENGIIVQSYPHPEFEEKNFDLFFSEYPIEIDNTRLVTLQYPSFQENQQILLSFPFSYLINADVVFSNEYKILLHDPINPESIIYTASYQNDVKQLENIGFSQSEADNKLTISYQTNMFGKKIQDNYTVLIDIWDPSFTPSDQTFSYIARGGLIVFALGITVLLISRETYAQKEKKISAELVKTNEKLRDIDRHKDEFSAMITHELKTPLVPIIGFAKMLTKKGIGAELNEQQLDAVHTIQRNAKRLENLINDIMDARKLEMGKLKFDEEKISVDKFLDNLEYSYRSILEEKGIQFTVDSDCSNVHILVDESRLRQVFDNMIGNAVKFVPQKDGKIQVACKKQSETVLFSIQDNGVGIPPSEQKNTFKKFYQIDTSDRRKSEGSGLGLAICKGIINHFGGKIWLESDGKTGTTFFFTIPHC